ncbi:hypothetical protein EVAR_30567_1 [Eumeta japonica]|uniref:Uncharacterized protein n=1 Tax=Eumeta variegata TaxID=151549 RepID=A0A4C1VN27_EUMVA|nr:hypothetical protein EVAR_30567_1 [Eumeta japonica]
MSKGVQSKDMTLDVTLLDLSLSCAGPQPPDPELLRRNMHHDSRLLWKNSDINHRVGAFTIQLNGVRPTSRDVPHTHLRAGRAAVPPSQI